MPNPTATEVLARAGLLDETTRGEFGRWGHPLPELSPDGQPPPTQPGQVVEALHEVLEGEEAVEIRQTDLDILKHYLATQQRGKLHLVVRDLRGTVQNTSSFPITFGTTQAGEYIIPWASGSIEEYLTDPESYLLVERHRIHFSATRELFYGHEKSFMIATARGERGQEG